MRPTPYEAAALLLVVVIVVAATGRLPRRKAKPDVAGDYLAATGTRDATHAPIPGWVTALVGLAAGFGAIAAGVSLTAPATDKSNRDNSTATANRTTCLSTLAANSRLAGDILGVLISNPKGKPLAAPIAAKLHVPTDVTADVKILQARYVASLLDDQRIGDPKNPICPFRPGDPHATPTQPVDSETAKLEAKLRRTGHP